MEELENNNLPEEIDATEEEVALAEKMAGCLIKIWKLVFPFVAGWLLIMLGAALMHYTVDKFTLGFLFLLGGLIAIPLPTVIMVWSGVGLKEAFNTEYFIETSYSDGRKTVEYDFGGTMANKILVLALAFLLGYAITPIRMVLGMLTFWKAKKKLGVGKIPFLQDVWMPVIAAVGALVLGVVLNLTITAIADKKYDKEQHSADYTAEQTAEIVAGWETAWADADLEYFLNGANEEEGNRCLVTVKKEGGKYTFTLSATRVWNENTNQDEDTTEAQSPLPFGTYVLSNGVWEESAAGLNQTQKAFLQKCTVESMLDTILSQEPILKDKSFMGKEGYILIAYTTVNGEEENVQWEVYKDDKMPYRICGSSGYEGIYGANFGNVMFH